MRNENRNTSKIPKQIFTAGPVILEFFFSSIFFRVLLFLRGDFRFRKNTHKHWKRRRQTDLLVKCNFYYSFIARKYFSFHCNCDARFITQFVMFGHVSIWTEFWWFVLFSVVTHTHTFFVSALNQSRGITAHSRIPCNWSEFFCNGKSGIVSVNRSRTWCNCTI